MRNLYESFRKDVTYDNIKSHKKAGLHSFSRKHIFEKTTGGGLPQALLGLQLQVYKSPWLGKIFRFSVQITEKCICKTFPPPLAQSDH